MNKSPWKTVRLEKVAEIQTGISKSASRKLTDPIEVPYLRVANVQDGHLDLSVIKHISIERKNLERYTLKTGDVLLTEGGDFDKLGRGTVWNNEIESCVHQNHVFSVRTDASVLLPEFLSILTASSYGKRYFISCSKQSTNLASINSTQLKQFPVLLPSLDVQKSIVSASKLWDNAIEKTEALIAAKEKQFEWLKSQLLLNNPKSKRWNTNTLGEFIVEKKEKSTTPDLYPCLTSSRRGIFLQEDYFSKQVASKDNSGYKIMSRGDFTFRSMSDDGLFVFNKQTIIDKGLISPAYGVFSPKQNMDSDFLYYFLNSPAFRQALSREVQGGTRTALKLNALKKLEVKIPCIQEQNDIASKLNIAKKEIDLVKELLEKYRSQKRGLMQKLLTGEWQVSSSQPVAEDMYQEASA
ncbi:restriction endonuclease subunit S [Proteus vulgaris]|uniref:restriction endonuclease subunit S n=1 Tax=Proteus vulgaris TaxID=585 RepID=UPI000C9FD6C4|nr:restriction endonuclease subunit S [Proteus vulgaris]UBH61901.1 restriction endonuclease subunit S [Proteus vulgaris]VTP79716.1 Type I restriction enzyme EcoKI specificity protein [Proteus vulgaris]